MKSLIHSLIRISAFVTKEIAEVMRQPRLLLTLVLGPFLILLLFGVGYRNQARVLRTLFVTPADSPLRQQIEEYAPTLGDQLDFQGIVATKEEALARLRRGEIDVVVVTPENAYATIQSSQQAAFELFHREIDPFQVDYVTYFGQLYIDEVNRRVLLAVTQQGQTDANQVEDDVKAARANAAAMRQALQAGNRDQARQEQGQLVQRVDNISLALGASLGLLSGVQANVGGGTDEAAQIMDSLASVRQNTDSLNDSQASGSAQELEQATQVETDLAKLEERLQAFTSIDANVLVRPFRSEAKSIATLQPRPIDFFAPAVLALLLQHLAITFAALSIVRERSGGTMELFRVSPLSAAETLIGKYVSYLIFGTVIGVLLTLLLIFGLQMPMLGNWWNYALVVLALLFTSLGFGFVISLISQTDSQAVQYTMLLLLTSVFFSGFMMSLDTITPAVRVVSWSLPTTYGIVLLRDLVLRGVPPDAGLLGGLAGIGLGLCLLAWWMLRRRLMTS
jgi:ABC-2 type transport system permease protein